MRVPTPGGQQAPARGTISGDALKYKGLGYVYGGNASRPGDWDCSSFVSYVLGHDLGLALPGGRWGAPGFPPNSHGPVVTSYASWTGAQPVKSPQAGDLCCCVGSGTNGHIGIAISGTHMISALSPSNGTQVTPIVGTGPSGAPLVYRRVRGAAGGVATAAGGAAGTAGAGAGALVGLAVAVAAIAAVAAAAVLAGVALAVAVTLAAGATAGGTAGQARAS